MRKFSLLLFTILLTTAGFGQDIVCAWTFDGLTGANSGASNTEKVIPANTEWGAGTFYADGTNGSDNLNNGENPEINAFGGNVLNDPRDNPSASQAVAIASTSANGKSVVFKFSMAGFQDLQLSYAQRGTATGFNTETWSYSTDGVNFTEMETISGTNVTTFTLREVNFTAATALNDAANVYIKLTVDGCSSGSGNNRIDNVVFRANMAGPDVYPPVVTSVSVENATTLKVIFNEALDAGTAQNGANYVIAGQTMTATLAGNIVTLTAAPGLTEGLTYTMNISNVADVVGNVMLPYSTDFTFGVDAEFQVANIAELRSKLDYTDVSVNNSSNVEYKLSGEVVVTAIASYNNQKVLQDASGAILVYDPNNTLGALEVGDKVKDLYGSLTNYFGFLEFKPTQPYGSLVSIYQDVTPLTITLPQLNDQNFMIQHQAELIQLNNVTFNTTGSFAVLNTYEITQNGVTASAVYPYFQDANTVGADIPTGAVNITGFNFSTSKIGSTYLDYRYYIVPRSMNDFTTGLPQYLTDNDIVIYPNPVADQLTVTLRTNNFLVTSMSVFDINGKLINTQAVSDNQIEMNTQSLAAGNYFLRLSDGKNCVTTKFVKR